MFIVNRSSTGPKYAFNWYPEGEKQFMFEVLKRGNHIIEMWTLDIDEGCIHVEEQVDIPGTGKDSGYSIKSSGCINLDTFKVKEQFLTQKDGKHIRDIPEKRSHKITVQSRKDFDRYFEARATCVCDTKNFNWTGMRNRTIIFSKLQKTMQLHCVLFFLKVYDYHLSKSKETFCSSHEAMAASIGNFLLQCYKVDPTVVIDPDSELAKSLEIVRWRCTDTNCSSRTLKYHNEDESHHETLPASTTQRYNSFCTQEQKEATRVRINEALESVKLKYLDGRRRLDAKHPIHRLAQLIPVAKGLKD